MLDTNLIIYFLEDIEPYASKVENLLNSFMRRENKGLISTINFAEVLTGFYLAGDGETAAKTKSLFKDSPKTVLKSSQSPSRLPISRPT